MIKTLNTAEMESFISARIIDIFEKANSPNDEYELFVLYLGSLDLYHRSEFEKQCQVYYKQQRTKRNLNEEVISNHFDLVRFIKKAYNYYFRNDLYGLNKSDSNIIMSSGSLDEDIYPIPESLKYVMHYAVDQNLYGYSDSLGLENSREAIRDYENSKSNSECYSKDNIAITLGATQAISSLVDMLSCNSNFPSDTNAIIASPNYPPLAASINSRIKTKLVSVEINGKFDINLLKSNINKDTRVILLQSVLNPSGLKISNESLIDLLKFIPDTCFLIIDECHDCYSESRASFPFPIHYRNVIRVNSASKFISAPGLKMGWIVADQHIIDDLYEYASSTYGSPISVFYSFLEFLVRFETLKIEGCSEIDSSLAARFGKVYPFTTSKINQLYKSYLKDTEKSIKKVMEHRDIIFDSLESSYINTVKATHSINICLDISFSNYNSYEFYRNTLSEFHLSLFPGLLNFRLGDNDARITVSQKSSNIIYAKNILDKIRNG